jgi:hypothetical protein
MTKELALNKARETIDKIYSDLETSPIMTAEWETSAQKILAQVFEDYEQKLEIAREALEEIACKGLDQRPRARIALERLK